MPIQVRLIVADPARREWLKNVLGCDSKFAVISVDPNVEDGRYADLFIVDLAHPQASRPRFWMVIHLMYSEARLMAVADRPIDEAALQAALHAGAIHFVEWTDSAARFCDMALAAYEGCFRVAPEVFVAASALFRRLNKDEQSFQIGDLRVELTKPHVIWNGQPIYVTSQEHRVLAYLARNAGQVVPYAEIGNEILGQPVPITKANDQLKSLIRRLRRKIEPDPKHPQYLQNVHGQGYCMPPHVTGREPPASTPEK